MDYKELMKLVGNYVDLLDDPSDPDYIEIKIAYRVLENKIKELCDNQRVITIKPDERLSRPDYQPTYKPEYKSRCSCDGWGCWKCCSSEQEIRGKSGIFG